MTKKPVEFIVTGIDVIDVRLKEFERKAANRIARGALSKGAQVGVKLVKKEIPSLRKRLRNSIGWSVKKNRNGITEAKFGAAGKRKTKGSAISGKRRKKGVGIGWRNIHWWILGTDERRQKSGKYTGKMPAHDVVAKATRTGRQVINSAIISRAQQLFEREAKKLGR